MNRVISEKALQGQNGLIREKYITISIHEDTYHKAQIRLFKRAEDIQNNWYPNEETSIIYADDRARKGTPL